MSRGGLPEMPQVEYDLEQTCWRYELECAFAKTGDSKSDVGSMAPSDDAFSRRFHAGWGSTNGEPFTLWTRRFVCFPRR